MNESLSQHEQAFEEFARRAKDRLGDSIANVILYGSAARGETRGIDSDVDVLVVVESTGYETELRDIAYDVMLDYGVLVSLNIKTVEQFEVRKNHPFLKHVLREGRSHG